MSYLLYNKSYAGLKKSDFYRLLPPLDSTDGSGGSEDVASGADRHLDITFGLQVLESSSLVYVLFREVFSQL